MFHEKDSEPTCEFFLTVTIDGRRKKGIPVSCERFEIWFSFALNNIAFLHIGRQIARCTDRSNSFKFPAQTFIAMPDLQFHRSQVSKVEIFPFKHALLCAGVWY